MVHRKRAGGGAVGRIRLLEVRLDVDPSGIDRLEAELPVLAGGAPGFFHNQAPLLGGGADAALIEQARGFLGVADQGGLDGRSFDSEPALARALEEVGCRRLEWNGCDGPANGIGRSLSRRVAGRRLWAQPGSRRGGQPPRK